MFSITKKYYLFLILIVIWAFFYIPNLGVIPLGGSESLRVAIALKIENISNLFRSELFEGLSYKYKTPIFSYFISLFIDFFKSFELSLQVISRLPGIFLILSISTYSYLRLIPLGLLKSFFISVFILLSSSNIYFGRSAQIEVLHNSLIYLSFIEYILFLICKKKNRNLFLVGLFQGLAFITKGPIGIFILILFVLQNFKNIKDCLYSISLISISMGLIVIPYYITSSYLDGQNLSVLSSEIFLRFIFDFDFSRILYERLRAIIYFLPNLIIVFEFLRYRNYSLEYKLSTLILFLSIGLFVLPGFQAQYITPLILLSSIPAGIYFYAWVNKFKFFKVFSILIPTLVLISLSVYWLPHKISNKRNTFIAQESIIDAIEKDNTSNNILLFYPSWSEFMLPYLYASNLENKVSYISKARDIEKFKDVYFIASNEYNYKKIISKANNSCNQVEKIETVVLSDGFLMEQYKTHLYKFENCNY